MRYEIDFKLLAIWIIGLSVISAGGYFLYSSFSGASQEISSISVEYEDGVSPGETTTASFFNSSSGEEIAGEEVYVDGENVGLTDSSGEISFTVPDSDFELELRSDNFQGTVEQVSIQEDSDTTDEETEDDDSTADESDEDDEETTDETNGEDEETTDETNGEDEDEDTTDEDDGFDASESIEVGFTPPEIGQTNYVEVSDSQGEPVEGETVYLDGDEIGETDDNGRVNFNVPNQSEFTVSTDFNDLETTESVDDYVSDDEDEDGEDENGEADHGQTGIYLDSDPVSDTTNRVLLYEEGDRVSGETVYIEGDNIGETGTNGAVQFTVPFQPEITVSTDYDVDQETFNVQQEHQEPEITLEQPTDEEEFETFTGETTEIEFEYTVDITEGDGTSTLNIDGNEHNSDLDQGENTITENIELSGGNYDWNIEVETDEFSVTSDSRNLDINEIEPEEGLMLSDDPEAEEFLTITLYQEDEPVEGEEILINDEPYGETDEFGEIDFRVPNVEQITITTENEIDDLLENVEGHTDFYVQFESPLEAGETNEINVLSQDGGFLEDKTRIYADQEFVGETSSGKLNFTVPLNDEVAFTVNPEDQKSKDFVETVSRSTVELLIFSPSEDEEFDDYSVDMGFEINNGLSEDINYKATLDGEEWFEGSISGSSQTIQREETVRDAGAHELQIELVDTAQNIVVERQRRFETTQSIEPVQIEMYPRGEVDDYNADLEFTVSSPLDYDYELYFEGDLKAQQQDMESGTTTIDDMDVRGLEEGEYQWRVKVTDETGEEFEEIETFETLQEPPIAEISFISPEDGEEVVSTDNEVNIDFEIEAFDEDLEYEVVVDEEVEVQGLLDEGNNLQAEQFDTQVEESYEIVILAKLDDETVETEPVEIEVVDNESSGGNPGE